VPVFLLGALIVVSGAFWGGAVVDKHFGASSTASAASAFAGGAGGRALGASGAGGFAGAGGSGFEAPTAEGTVSAISGDDLTVAPTSGSKVEVVMSSSTVVTRSGQGAAGTLGVGDSVEVRGTKAADGTVTATSITATAPGTSSAAGGEGGAASGGGTGGTTVSGGGFSGDGSDVSG
jgi:hypothetical protein